VDPHLKCGDFCICGRARQRNMQEQEAGEEKMKELGPELARARTGPALTILCCFIVCTCIKIFSMQR